MVEAVAVRERVGQYTPEQFFDLLYQKTVADIFSSDRHYLRTYGYLPPLQTDEWRLYREAHVFETPRHSFFVLALAETSLQFNLIDQLPDGFSKSAVDITRFSVDSLHPQGGRIFVNYKLNKTPIDCWINNLWFWQRGQEIKNWPGEEILTDNGIFAYSELIRQIATGLPQDN